LLLTVLQSTVINFTQIYGVKPDLLLIFVVLTAMERGAVTGTVVGIVVGFILDGGILGINSLLFMHMGALSGLIFQKVLVSKYYAVIILVILSVSFLYEFLFYVMNFTVWGKGNLIYALTRVILPTAAYNTAVCIPFYKIMRRFSVEREL